MELMDDSLTHFLEQSEEPVAYYVQVNISHDIALAFAFLHLNHIMTSSCATPRYCTIFGWRISLRKRHSRSNNVRFLGLSGSSRMAWRSLAAQGSSSRVALHTWPYAPEPSGASRIRRKEPKRIGGRAGCAMGRIYQIRSRGEKKRSVRKWTGVWAEPVSIP